ncbi:hypothetical protein JCM5350_006449 [Sporobolomyces pararoseus]
MSELTSWARVGREQYSLTGLRSHRSQLLQFVTGTSRVPLEGFAALQGMSNQLDLPSGYTSYEEFRKMLLLAITEGNTGFAFA